MLTFFNGGGLTPIFKRRLQYAAVLISASCIGYLSGKLEWAAKKDLFQKDKLTQYECQDQINKMIESTKKPAIIYYYLPSYKDHHIVRGLMMKYSNIYPQNAIWVMVNLTKDLQQAQEALKSIIFPDGNMRLEVRFPKENIAIFQVQKNQELKLVKEVYSNRRETFNYNVNQDEFQAFLQENKVIEGEDPVLPTLRATEAALFQKEQ